MRVRVRVAGGRAPERGRGLALAGRAAAETDALWNGAVASNQVGCSVPPTPSVVLFGPEAT